MNKKPITIEDIISRGAAHRAQRITVADMRRVPTCFFDIEASGLDADFGILLCASVKAFGGKMKTFRLDGDGYRVNARPWDDSRVAEAIRNELEKYMIVVHHYGDRYDIPFLNTRLIGNRQRLLDTSQMCFVDTWWNARKRMKLHSNRLASLITHLQTKVTKSGLDGHLWTRAVAGDSTALDKVVEHNIRDVKALEEVCRLMASYMALRYTYLK